MKSCDEERWSNLVTNTWAWFSNSSGLVNIRLQVIGSARQVAAAGAPFILLARFSDERDACCRAVIE